VKPSHFFGDCVIMNLPQCLLNADPTEIHIRFLKTVVISLQHRNQFTGTSQLLYTILNLHLIAERGIAERGIAERGIAERGIAERGIAERGIAERGTAEQGLQSEGKQSEGSQSEGSQSEGSQSE
jgi:hypothetical protein